jgi:putative addiction module antidote
MQLLKIHKIGDSLGVILAPEILQKLQVGEGDYLSATATTDGIEIMASDSEFELGMEAYHKVAGKYNIALQELAK